MALLNFLETLRDALVLEQKLDADIILRKYYGDGTYPVNPFKIACRCGIEVRMCPQLEGGFVGKLSKHDGNVVIEINPHIATSTVQQRFMLAHLLGHYFAGVADVALTIDDIRTESCAMVAVVSKFARRLLMPREFIEHILYTLQISSLAQIAKLLNVSKKALTLRLEQLRII